MVRMRSLEVLSLQISTFVLMRGRGVKGTHALPEWAP